MYVCVNSNPLVYFILISLFPSPHRKPYTPVILNFTSVRSFTIRYTSLLLSSYNPSVSFSIKHPNSPATVVSPVPSDDTLWLSQRQGMME